MQGVAPLHDDDDSPRMEAQLCIACGIAQASKNDQGVALCNLFQFISLLVVSYSAEAHVLSH